MLCRLALLLFLNFALSFQILAATDIKGLEIQLDSLLAISPPDKAAITNTYLHLLQLQVENNQIEAALLKAEEGLALASEWEEPEYQFHFLHSLGVIHYFPLDDYASSLNYLLQANHVGDGKVDANLLVQNYAIMSEVYVRMSDMSEALKIQLKGLDLAIQIQDTALIAEGYYALGGVYVAQEDNEKALESFLTALQYANSIQNIDPRLGHALLGSVAETYLELKEPDKALKYIDMAYNLADSVNYQLGLAYDDSYYGEYYRLKEEYSKSYTYLRRADLAFKRFQLRLEEGDNGILLAEVFNHTREFSKALAILDTVENIAETIQNAELMMGVVKTRAQSLDSLGRKDLAYDNLRRYLQLRDSILGDPSRLEFARTESGFTVGKMEQEVAEIREQQQQTKRNMIIGGIIAGFIILLVLLIMGYQRNRDLNRVNRLLAVKNEEINLQNERLASSNEELRQFAHVTSHDLREPLRSIGGFATLLERKFNGGLDGKTKEYLNFITSGVRRMDKLLADLMNYSVIGILEQKFEPVAIETVISGLIESLHQEKRAQGAKISIHNLPEIVADARQMRLLFENLIDNAIKFRSDKAPVIQVNCQSIDNNQYLFSIRDNGIGMDEAYQEQIFSLFLRLHNNGSDYEGTGVGLSICRKIVQQHKGKIWIESKLGEGTTVFFQLPASPLEQVDPINWRAEN